MFTRLSHVVVHERGTADLAQERCRAKNRCASGNYRNANRRQGVLASVQASGCKRREGCCKGGWWCGEERTMTESEALDILNLEKTPDGKLPLGKSLNSFTSNILRRMIRTRAGRTIYSRNFFVRTNFTGTTRPSRG